jgi:hypothetical protein
MLNNVIEVNIHYHHSTAQYSQQTMSELTTRTCTFTEEELAAFVTKIVKQTVAETLLQSHQAGITTTSSSIPAQVLVPVPSNIPVRDARKVEPIPAEVALNRAMRLAVCARPSTDKETQWGLEGIESMIDQ